MVPGVEIGNDLQKCVPSLPAPFDVSWKWPQVWRHCGWALIRVLHSYSCCKHYQEPFCAPESLLLLIKLPGKKKKSFFFLADAFYWVWIKLLWLSTFYEMNKGMILAKVFLYSCHMLFVRLYPLLSQWRTAGAQALFSLVSTCSDVTYFFAVSWQSQTVLLIAVLVYWVISADRALLGSVPSLKKPFLPPKLKVHLSKAELIRREL